MKTLLLMRHAKSSWKFPELDDFQRPLNGRGKRNAPTMGQRIKATNYSIGCIMSSPAVRAFTTASTIAQAIGFDQNKIIKEPSLYMGSSSAFLSCIQQFPENTEVGMLFGHNPAITSFTNQLTNHHVDNVPTCGVACIGWDIKLWSEANRHQGKLLWLDFPKNEKGPLKGPFLSTI